MEEKTLTQLIRKQLRGEPLTAGEQELLQSWLQESEEHKKIAAQFQSVWEGASAYKENFEPDKKAAWEKIEKFMLENQEESARIVPMKARKSWFGLAASLAILVGMAGVIWWWVQQNSSQILVAMTRAGEQKELLLADGSKVIMKENSRFEYPADFRSDTRQVRLSGEAFFDVEHRPAQPFIIETERTSVSVLGTSFAVRDFSAEAACQVTVRSGKVRFQPLTSSKYLDIEAAEKAVFDTGKKELSKSGVDDLNDLAWATARLEFRNTLLSSALLQIGNYYGVTFVVDNPVLSSCTLNATFDLKKQNLADLTGAIELALGINIEKSKATEYRVSGESCK